MLRIEGKRGNPLAATLFAVIAVFCAWITQAAPAGAAQGGTQQWIVSGPQGGPFSPTTGTLDVTNNFNTKLRWYAIGDTSWVRFSGFNGVIKPGQTKSISVSLNDAVVGTLAKGTYKAYIAFRDPVSGSYASAADLILNVLDGPPPPSSGQLTVTPNTGLSSSGQQGGSFSPLSKTYTLENSGGADLHWKATFDADWALTPGAANGTLQPGASQPFVVQLDSTLLAGLPQGQHAAKVRFFDTDQNVEVASRDLTIDVKSGPSGSGWTDFKPSTDTRIVYVSSSQGNDSNDGLSQATPKRTIGAGASLLRNGYPDWLLLKKGDTWNQAGPFAWNTNGKSQAEKQLFSSYGTGARPRLFFPGGSTGVSTYGRSHLAIVDLNILSQAPYNLDVGEGISPYSCTDILIEGCLVEAFSGGIVSNGMTHSTVRRNVVYNAQNTGIFAAAPLDCLFEENVVYRVGETLVLQGSSISPHGFYISCAAGTTSYTVRNNIVSDVGFSGMDLRPDNGVCDNNLILRVPAGIDIAEGPCWTNFPKMTISVTNNVILDGRNPFKSGGNKPYGMRVSQGEGSTLDGNIICNSGTAASYGLRLDPGDPSQICKDLTISRNIIYNWGGTHLRIDFAANAIQNLTVQSNDFQMVDANSILSILESGTISKISSGYNRFYNASLSPDDWFLIEWVGKSLSEYKSAVGDTSSTSTQVQYKSPAIASIASYQAIMGKTASHEAFMAEAIKQSKDLWRNEYTAAAVNAWVRDCFNK